MTEKETEKEAVRWDRKPQFFEDEGAFMHISHWERLGVRGKEFKTLRSFDFDFDYGVCVSGYGSVWYSRIAAGCPHESLLSYRYYPRFSEIQNWREIASVSMNAVSFVGLREDGTVVAAGENKDGRCDEVKEWTDIVDICAGSDRILGVRADGTVVQAPAKAYSYNLKDWKLFESVPSLTRNFNLQFHQAWNDMKTRKQELRQEFMELGFLSGLKKRRIMKEILELGEQDRVMWWYK